VKTTVVASLTHVVVVVDYTLPIQLQRLAKLKNLALVLLSVYSAYQVFIVCQTAS